MSNKCLILRISLVNLSPREFEICSAPAVNNISESVFWNSSTPIKFPRLSKLANQSTLNKAHAIEVTKTCKVAFIMEL